MIFLLYGMWKGSINTRNIIDDFKFLKKFKKNSDFTTLDAIYLLGQKYGYECVYLVLKNKNLLDDKELEFNNKDRRD